MNDKNQLEVIPCNICHSLEYETLYIKGGLPIAQCLQCGLVYANPRLTKDEIWKRYSPTYFWDEYMPAHHADDGVYRGDIHRKRAQSILSLLQPHKLQGKLLEVGCAAGFFLKVAKEDGWDVTGIEIMSPAVKYGQETLELDIHEGTLMDVSLPDASFDVVVLIETVEHLLDPLANLELVFSLLRPGGVVLVAVPNQDSIMRSVLGSDWSVLSPAEHLYYFTESTMSQLLEKAGFSELDFIWKTEGQTTLQTMNPHHSHNPNAKRTKLAQMGTRFIGPFAKPFVIKTGHTDRLMVIAKKPV